jgi:hypothetical protein
MGALAATGLVLCVRLAGDASRGRLRIAAGAALPLLGLGLYLSFSRGALLAAVLGLAALLASVPHREQIAAAATAAVTGALAAVAVTRFPAVESLAAGGDAKREGLEMLLLLALLCASAAAAVHLIARRSGEKTGDGGTRGRRIVAALAAVVILIPVLGAPLALEAGDAPSRGADAGRFGSVGSNRYAYWRVALETLAEHPLDGVGPSGFRVAWMEERPIDEAARDAHSLQLETGAELGLPGLAFLGLLGGAIAAAGAAVLRRRPAAGAGLVGALVTWSAAAAVDWMWEMPAVALVGLLLSAAIAAEAAATPEPSAAD